MSEIIENIIDENEKNKNTKERISDIKASLEYTVSDDEINNINNLKNIVEDSTIPRKYTYVPKLTAIFSDGTVYDLLQYTTIVQTEINLDIYVFPLISVRLDVPVELVPKIQFDDDLVINYELMYNANTDLDTATMYNILWNINLKKVKQESSPIMMNEIFYKEVSEEIRRVPLELKLIPEDCLNANKILFSGVYSKCDMVQMLTLLTEKLNYKTYISRPDNIRKYNQVIFPPCNIFYGIEYLDQYYGLYDRGLKMFYGFGNSVIMSKNHYIETGMNKVKVSFAQNNNGYDIYNYTNGGIEQLGSDYYISITPNKVKILDKRHYMKETLGTIVTTYSRDDHVYFEQAREYDYTEKEDIIEKVKSYVNQYNNTNKEKEYLLRSVYSRQIELMLEGALLPPDGWFKVFDINFDSNNYNSLNGLYCMHGYYFRLAKISNKNSTRGFDVTSAIELTEI